MKTVAAFLLAFLLSYVPSYALPAQTTSSMQHKIDIMLDCYNNVYNVPGGLGIRTGEILIACSNLAAQDVTPY